MSWHENIPQRKYFKVGVNLHFYDRKDLKEGGVSIHLDIPRELTLFMFEANFLHNFWPSILGIIVN